MLYYNLQGMPYYVVYMYILPHWDMSSPPSEYRWIWGGERQREREGEGGRQRKRKRRRESRRVWEEGGREIERGQEGQRILEDNEGRRERLKVREKVKNRDTIKSDRKFTHLWNQGGQGPEFDRLALSVTDSGDVGELEGIQPVGREGRREGWEEMREGKGEESWGMIEKVIERRRDARGCDGEERGIEGEVIEREEDVRVGGGLKRGRGDSTGEGKGDRTGLR
jgi:hypothetical protein